MKNIIRHDIIKVVLISILTTLIYFWGNIFGELFFWEDIVEYVYPTQSFAASSNGIPFWNPYIFAGMPFYADLQVGFFYPLNRIFDFFIYEGKLPFSVLQLVIIFHFIIAQINSFYLGKNWGLSFWAAIYSAIAYSFSMIMVCHVIHPMMLYHLAWLPLIMTFFDKAINNNSIYYSILAGLIFGFTVLSGHPQTTIYISILLFIYGITQLVIKIYSNEFNIKQIIAPFITFIVAISIFSIQYFPSKQLAEESRRSEITYEMSTEGSLYFKQLLSSIVPNIFGSIEGGNYRNSSFYLKFDGTQGIHYYWETSYYFGILTIILGIIGFMTLYKDKVVLSLLIISIFGLFFSLGSNFFFFDIIYNIPFIGDFRNPARMMFFPILGFAFTSGFILDKLKDFDKKKKKILFLVFGVISLLLILVFSGFFFENLGTPEKYHNLISDIAVKNLFFVIIGLIVSLVIVKNKFKKEYLIPILILILFIDLYGAGNNFNKSSFDPTSTLAPNGYNLQNEFKKAFIPNKEEELFRVNSRLYQPISYMALKRNQGMLDNIMLLEGYNPLLLKRINPPTPDNQTLMNLLNVKFVLGFDNKLEAPRFYQNMDMMPRAWFVNDYIYYSSEEIEKKMGGTEIDFKRYAVLEEKPTVTLEKDIVPEYEIDLVKYENNRIEYKISTNTDGLIVFSEIFYPNWKANVNNIESKLYRANFSLRAVEVKSGDSIVSLEYKSSSFSNGMMITLISLFISLIGLYITKKYAI